jgi:hypothetical protein
VVALVDELVLLLIGDVGEHLEAVGVARDESSFAEESSMLLHTVLCSPRLGGGDTFCLGLARQRVLDDVVCDGLAAGASVGNVLRRITGLLIWRMVGVLLDVRGGLVDVFSVHVGVDVA